MYKKLESTDYLKTFNLIYQQEDQTEVMTKCSVLRILIQFLRLKVKDSSMPKEL